MKEFFKAILALVVFFSATFLYAAQNSPVGEWKTVDDKTKKVESIVKIWKDSDGKLRGKIKSLVIKPGEEKNPLCDKCKGKLANKPIIGMTFLWGFKEKKKGNGNYWISGKILDPDDGKVYSCKMTMSKNKKSLVVRGYVGISLFGRSQTWLRNK